MSVSMDELVETISVNIGVPKDVRDIEGELEARAALATLTQRAEAAEARVRELESCLRAQECGCVPGGSRRCYRCAVLGIPILEAQA